jgi:hypothetical protein
MKKIIALVVLGCALLASAGAPLYADPGGGGGGNVACGGNGC